MAKTTKKVTLEDILNAKKVIEEKQNIPFYSKTFDGEIEIEDVSPEKILSIVNSSSKDEPLRGDYELIYECCPIFRSKEMQEAYNIEDPVMVVEKAFGKNIIEIDSLAKHILKRYGYYEDVQKIKKQS